MIIKDLGYVSEPSGKKQHRVVVECAICKKQRETRMSRVKDCFTVCNKCKIKQRNQTHGLSRHPLANVYNTMKQRCKNPNHKMFYRYGKRGITVCDEWKNDFMSFYNWAIENGYEKGLSIDRIDNDGNYKPSNCQWITIEENIAKNAKLNKEDIDWICKTYKNTNITQNELACVFDVDKSRIGQILKENNIKTSYRGGTKKKIPNEEVEIIKQDKRFAKIIAKEYGVHTSTIYAIKKGRY